MRGSQISKKPPRKTQATGPFKVEVIVSYVFIGRQVAPNDDAVVQKQNAEGQKHGKGIGHVEQLAASDNPSHRAVGTNSDLPTNGLHLSPVGYQEFSQCLGSRCFQGLLTSCTICISKVSCEDMCSQDHLPN